MVKHLHFKSWLLLLCLLVMGSKGMWADTITFDFEDESAHRTSGSNSYSSNSYTENGTTIALTYADAVSSGSPLSGSYHIVGRIAKNTKNSPVIKLGPVAITNRKVTGVSYLTKGVTAMKMVVEYSTDNSTWNTIETLNSMPTTATTKTNSNLNITGESFYLRFTVSVSSSNSSNRDFNLDNIVITHDFNSVLIETISLPSNASVIVGGDVTLTPTLTPNNANETITWESDNTSIATVSGGVVHGVAAGSTTIRAKSPSDPNIKGECTVTVSAPKSVEGVSLKSSTTLYLGGATETLVPTFTPADATNQDVTWESSDETTVSVDDNGVITAHKLTNGTPVTITVTTDDGGYTANCAVTVIPIAVTGVSLNQTSATLRIGKTLTLTPTVSPANATNKNVIWSTSNSGIVTVDDGIVTAVGEGVATITVTTESGSMTATCTITVNDGSIDLTTTGTISFTTFSKAILGDSYGNRSCELTGSDGNTYTWTEKDGYFNGGWQLKASTGRITSPIIKSNYGFRITVDNITNSVVISDGTNSDTNTLTTTKTYTTFTISSTSSYAKFTNIVITPLKPSRTFTWDKDGDQEVTVNATLTNAATASPTGTVTYSSSNTAVATVNSEGVVTGVKSGTTVITATVAADESYEESTSSYTVTVNKAATTLSFAASEQTVELVDGSATFTASATPADGTRVITYSSDNATVNANTGTVTLTAIGDYVINAASTATDKYLAANANYTLHVQDSRVPVVTEATLALVLENANDLTNVAKDDMGTISATYTKAAGFAGSEVVSFASSDPTVFYIEDDNYMALKGGTVTVSVTVTSGGNKMFTTVEKDFTVTVINNNKTVTEITVLEDGTSFNTTYGTPINLTVGTTAGYEGTLVATLANSAIAEIGIVGENVTITPKATGSTTLTFSADETANYTAATNVVLTINVNESDAKTSTNYVDGVIEDLDFKKNYVPDTWEMTTTNSGNYQAWTNNESNNYISANGYKSGNRYAGTYDYITDEYDLTNYVSANLIFEHAGQYFNTISDGIKLFAEVEGVEQELTINNYFVGSSYSSYVTNTTNITSLCGGKAKIIFRYISDGTSNNTGRWDIKSFKITGMTLPTTTATVATSGYGTYCYEYPIDLDQLDENVKAYIVTNVDGATVTFTQVTGSIKGGVPFILYGTAGDHTLYTAASSTTVPDGNMLVGTLAPKYVATVEGDYTNFGLSQGAFVKINNGTVPANKAYLPVLTSNLTGLSRLQVVFVDEVEGISDMVRQRVEDNHYYNLRGQRVEKPTSGMYIVNGKKVVIK